MRARVVLTLVLLALDKRSEAQTKVRVSDGEMKIVPDTSARTVVRYRLDAVTGGILDIKEFTGIRGLAVRKQ